MQTIVNFISQNWSTLISGSVSIITCCLGLRSFWRNKKSETSRERLENVVSPLFEIVEPLMMCSTAALSANQISGMVKIFTENRLLVGGNLRQELVQLQQGVTLESKNLRCFCEKISTQYDILCGEVSIPLRPLCYRLKCYSFCFVWKYLLITLLENFCKSIVVVGAIVCAAFGICHLYNGNTSMGLLMLAPLLILIALGIAFVAKQNG